jgi:uncharacterized protein YcfJ
MFLALIGSTQSSRLCAARAAVIMCCAAVCGCENAGQGAVSGAAVGALGGLAIGSLSGDAGAGAAIGAIGGAVAGGIIGDQNRRAAEHQQEMRYGGEPK